MADIETIYASPLTYADQVVCTEGFMTHTESYGSFLLPHESYDAFQPAVGRIDVDWVFPEPDSYYEGPRETVRAIGLVRAYRPCRSEDLTLDELAARFAENDYCPPVNVPLNMDVVEIEYLER